MAPERFEEMPYDGRADVYSLGVMLHRCSAIVPFPAKELMAVAMQHLRETPPCLRELNPDVSAEVGTVVSQAMSKNMAERPAAAELMKRFGRAMRRRATDSWLTPFSLSLVSHILGAGCPVPVLIELGLDNGQRAREAILR